MILGDVMTEFEFKIDCSGAESWERRIGSRGCSGSASIPVGSFEETEGGSAGEDSAALFSSAVMIYIKIFLCVSLFFGYRHV